MASFELILRPSPPFRLDLTVWALRRMPQNEIDQWDGRSYSRVLALERGLVRLEVRQPDERRILIAVSGRGTASLPRKHEMVQLIERMLGIRRNLAQFHEFASGKGRLAALAGNFAGFKPPRFPTVYEALVNAVACQQVSLHVCIMLLNRLARAWGRVWTGRGGQRHAFPLPRDLAQATLPELRGLGFSSNKAKAVIAISARVASGADLEDLEKSSDARVMEVLTQFPGIGPWSAEYVMLRGLGRTHVFPGGDSGARRSLQLLLSLKEPPDARRTAELTSRWHPHAGLLYFHFLLNKLRSKGCLGQNTVE